VYGLSHWSSRLGGAAGTCSGHRSGQQRPRSRARGWPDGKRARPPGVSLYFFTSACAGRNGTGTTTGEVDRSGTVLLFAPLLVDGPSRRALAGQLAEALQPFWVSLRLLGVTRRTADQTTPMRSAFRGDDHRPVPTDDWCLTPVGSRRPSRHKAQRRSRHRRVGPR
jgi:hypothetical protein